MKFLVVAALAGLLTACNSARIAGAVAVSSDREPAGVVLGTWFVGGCRDARGAPYATVVAAVKLVRTAEGRLTLVEMRDAYDSLVITNSFVRGPERVFQAAVKSSSSVPYLREYRMPASGAGSGRFNLVSKDWDSRETDGGFVAWYVKPALTCELSAGPAGATAAL